MGKTSYGIIGFFAGWLISGLSWVGYMPRYMGTAAFIFGFILTTASILYLIINKRKYHIVNYDRPRTIGNWLIGSNMRIVNPTDADVFDFDKVINYDDFKVWMKGKEFMIKN